MKKCKLKFRVSENLKSRPFSKAFLTSRRQVMVWVFWLNLRSMFEWLLGLANKKSDITGPV